MTRGQALQFVRPGRVELTDIEVPEPGSGQVVVRMLASSLCNHPEVRSYRGGQPAGYGSSYPMAPGEPGHEGVGQVVSAGAGVTTVAPGDLVVMTGHGGDPLHRSVVLRDADAVAVIRPGDRDPRPASCLEMFGCAYHCVRAGWREPGGFDGARVAVVGAGAIGLCAIQILRLWPVAGITALDLRSEKLDLAASLGATETVGIPSEADAESLAATLGTFDVVVECSGHIKGHHLANALVRRTLINVSLCPEAYLVHQGQWFTRGTTIYNPGVLTSDELRAVAALYNRGLIDPERMISRRIPPAPGAYLDAIRAIDRGRIVKALIEWNGK